MANEGQVQQNDGNGDIIFFTCVNQPIAKGTLLTLNADRGATAHSASVANIPVGVAVSEMVAGDGSTRIAARTRGIVRMLADGSITRGDQVTPGATPNRVQTIRAGAVSGEELSRIIGVALNTATVGTNVDILLKIS